MKRKLAFFPLNFVLFCAALERQIERQTDRKRDRQTDTDTSMNRHTATNYERPLQSHCKFTEQI